MYNLKQLYKLYKYWDIKGHTHIEQFNIKAIGSCTIGTNYTQYTYYPHGKRSHTNSIKPQQEDKCLHILTLTHSHIYFSLKLITISHKDTY